MTRSSTLPAALLVLFTATPLLSGQVAPAQTLPGPAAPAPNPDWNASTPSPDRIVLTWADDPATTQSVTWRTDTSVVSAVAEIAIATAAPDFPRSARRVNAATETVDARAVETANVTANYHAATFMDLLPGTLYAYRVGDGTRWSEWFQFRTASRDPEPFSFIYMGDAQNDILQLWSRTILESYATAPRTRFMIHAGDLVNRAHADVEWGE